jgi:periplasmic divalent cation tolerance protein
MVDPDDDDDDDDNDGGDGGDGGGGVGRGEGGAEKGGPKDVKVRVLLSTCPQAKAEELATFLVESSLAACVNIVPLVTSVYRWEGKLQKEPESLLVIKCPKTTAKTAVKRLVEKHPYDVPEVLVLATKGGNPDYMDWVAAAVR